MPITARVDHARRLVVARASGILIDEEVFGYQRDIWSRADVAGYDELIDMTAVEDVAVPSAKRVRELAALSASMDRPSRAEHREGKSRFAIVAPKDFAHAIGTMYEIFRQMDPSSTKQVAVFRTMSEALGFLGIDGPLEG